MARPNYIGNGMVYEPDGSLLVCEHVTSSVVRIRPNGDRQVVAFHYEGTYLNSPNDVVVKSDGAIYFSDPDYGRWDHAVGVKRPFVLGFHGVYRVPPGGGDVQLVVEQDTFDQPNGLCFSPDESRLYVNDLHARARVRRAGRRLAGQRPRASTRAWAARTSPARATPTA